MLWKEIPPALVDEFVEKHLPLFAGAGISVASGLPTGAQLAFELQDELFKNKLEATRPSPGDPLQLDLVALRFQTAFGRQRLNEHLIKRFQQDGLIPNEAHELAVELFDRIITTNFDTLFEDALKLKGRNAIVVRRDLHLPNTSLPDRVVVYKLHGDVATPERVVITKRDFTRIPPNQGLIDELRSTLLRSGLIFVGYGLGDPDFLRELDFCRRTLEQIMPKSYAVIPNADRDALFVKQCEEDNIDLISLSAIEFLREFKKLLGTLGARSIANATMLDSEVPCSAERDYLDTTLEVFKWIDFRGIPVLGGFLRVSIDDLFVPMSCVSADQSTVPPTRRAQPKSAQRSRKAGHRLLFRKAEEETSFFETLKLNSKLVILGDPGSGKTTLLRYIGHHLSQAKRDPSDIGLDRWYLPIFVPLRQYSLLLKSDPTAGVESFIDTYFKANDLGSYTKVAVDALRDGRAILLLDGLDEVASKDLRANVAASVANIALQYANCRIVVTSRKVGFPKGQTLDGFATFIVKPLTDEEIAKFIDLWCKATNSKSEEQNLVDAIKLPRVRVLAENPLLLTILARVYKAYRNLPERRAQLYAKCVEALLTTWDLVRELPPVFEDLRQANRIIGPLAYWIHKDHRGQYVTKEELLRKLAELCHESEVQRVAPLLTQIEERSGLLREMGLDQYAFTHLTFQEYYVAREALSGGKPFKTIRPHLRNERWQEVIILAAGLLDEQGAVPVTEYLRHFVEPRAKMGPLGIAKLNLLIGCLKDKVEPEPDIVEYVFKSLDYIAKTSTRGSLQDRLGQLPGFDKTDLGQRLLHNISEFVISDGPSEERFHALVFGYRILVNNLDEIHWLMRAMKTESFEARFLWGATNYLARALRSIRDGKVVAEIRAEIAAIPLQRRLQLVNADPDTDSLTIETWLAPEERALVAAHRSGT